MHVAHEAIEVANINKNELYDYQSSCKESTSTPSKLSILQHYTIRFCELHKPKLDFKLSVVRHATILLSTNEVGNN